MITHVYLNKMLTAHIVRGNHIYLPTGTQVLMGKIETDDKDQQFYVAEKLETMRKDGDDGVHNAMLKAVGQRHQPPTDSILTRYQRLGAQLADLMRDAEADPNPQYGNPLHMLNQQLSLFTTKRLTDQM